MSKVLWFQPLITPAAQRSRVEWGGVGRSEIGYSGLLRRTPLARRSSKVLLDRDLGVRSSNSATLLAVSRNLQERCDAREEEANVRKL
jgi:hypothetical protein